MKSILILCWSKCICICMCPYLCKFILFLCSIVTNLPQLSNNYILLWFIKKRVNPLGVSCRISPAGHWWMMCWRKWMGWSQLLMNWVCLWLNLQLPGVLQIPMFHLLLLVPPKSLRSAYYFHESAIPSTGVSFPLSLTEFCFSF